MLYILRDKVVVCCSVLRVQQRDFDAAGKRKCKFSQENMKVKRKKIIFTDSTYVSIRSNIIDPKYLLRAMNPNLQSHHSVR